MFEDSLLSSHIQPATRRVRWLTLSSLLLQISVASIWFVSPLLHPERLSIAPRHLVPLVRLERSDPPPRRVVSPQPAPEVPRFMTVIETSSPFRINTQHANDAAPPGVPIPTLLAGASMLPEALASILAPPCCAAAANVAPAASKVPTRLRVSSGVGAGMLLSPIRPTYPRVAAIAHVGGTVTVEAVIGEDGVVRKAHATSGPALLTEAAVDAVAHARYHPFLLNGQAVEVETRVTVNFQIGAKSD